MDAEGFKQTVCVHLDAMYRVALALCGSADDASDAVQNASMKLWEFRDRIAGVANVRAYCIAAVRNSAFSLISARKYAEPIDNTYPVADNASEEQRLDDADTVRLIETMMGRLPDNQRTVLAMRDFEGCEIAEIEQATGLSSGNIRVLLSRARGTIRKLFEKQ